MNTNETVTTIDPATACREVQAELTANHVKTAQVVIPNGYALVLGNGQTISFVNANRKEN